MRDERNTGGKRLRDKGRGEKLKKEEKGERLRVEEGTGTPNAAERGGGLAK